MYIFLSMEFEGEVFVYLILDYLLQGVFYFVHYLFCLWSRGNSHLVSIPLAHIRQNITTVSYTHLTLPTKRIV